MSMRAYQITSPGRVPSLLQPTTQPLPAAPKGTQILVRVAAASLNPADHAVPALGFVSRFIFTYPSTPGMDLSGVVCATGPQARDVSVGDRVVARVNPLKKPGSLAQYVLVDSDGYAVLAPSVSFEEGAALGTAGLTAYQTVKPYVRAGDHVFINSGSGGTGTFMIQVAKLLGCRVTVSCSTEKKELCARLGADDIIDYKTSDVVDELHRRGRVFALVLDNVGYSPANLYVKCAGVMLPQATFVVVTGNPNAIVSWLRPAWLGGGKNRIVMYLTRARRADLLELAGWLNDGKIKAVVDRTFAFEDAKEAFEYLMKGSAAGKVVVRVAEDMESLTASH